MKKFLSLLCLLLALTLVFCSCGGKKSDDDDKDTDTDVESEGSGEEAESDSVIDGLTMEECMPEPETMTREIRCLHIGNPQIHDSTWNPYETGDVLDIVDFECMDYIGERFNVDLVKEWDQNLHIRLEKEFYSGKSVDIVTPHPTDGLVFLMTLGVFENLLDLDNLRLDSVWWNQDQIENYTTANQLYVGVSDLAITWQGTPGLIFNKNLYEDLQFEENVYDLVEDGKWTFDKLYEMVQQSASDSIGDDGQKRYGMCMWENATASWSYAMGQRILVKDAEGAYALGYTSTGLTSVAEKVLLFTEGQKDNIMKSVEYNGTIAGSNLWRTFKEGRALFMNVDLSLFYLFTDVQDFEIGYLPLPKLTESQEDYYTFTAAGFISIPKAAQDSEQSATILEAMSVYYHFEMRPKFFESILLGRLSEKPEDYKSLEMIHNGKIYDVGYTLDEANNVRSFIADIVIPSGRAGSAAVFYAQNTTIFNNLVNFANTFIN